jgi:adenine phosphoribosyltransferase
VTDLRTLVRTIPGYPKPGILFRDITTLLLDPGGFRETIDRLAARYRGAGVAKVAGIEARGFILGGALAHALGAGFIPIRKRGKLPSRTLGCDYDLEYGTDRVEMHVDAVDPGDRVLLVDDLVATGGTALAAARLILDAGGAVHEAAFVIDLPDLGGARRLREAGHPVFTLIEFAGE